MNINSAVQQIKEITHEELKTQLENQIRPEFEEIKEAMKKFNNNAQTYLNALNSIRDNDEIQLLDRLKDTLYAEFFEIQNLLNAHIGQRIILTYVFVKSDGTREIRVSDNNEKHLERQGKLKTLKYVVKDHYQILKNSLPQEDNEGLEETAKEVSERRRKNEHYIVLWDQREKRVGYMVKTEGPINEAYVNFYIHNIQLRQAINIEDRINRFMLDINYGAIKADATRGYFIGDVSRDGIQYAVKGNFGSPQGVREIIKEFQEIMNSDYSETSLKNFINKFTIAEQERKLSPQIKKMTEDELNELLVDISKNF